jgi:hypothetical protein
MATPYGVGDPGAAGRRATPLVGQGVPGPAWEVVEAGRYRPLRIRGSFPGRELG